MLYALLIAALCSRLVDLIFHAADILMPKKRIKTCFNQIFNIQYIANCSAGANVVLASVMMLSSPSRQQWRSNAVVVSMCSFGCHDLINFGMYVAFFAIHFASGNFDIFLLKLTNGFYDCRCTCTWTEKCSLVPPGTTCSQQKKTAILADGTCSTHAQPATLPTISYSANDYGVRWYTQSCVFNTISNENSGD